MKNENIVRLYDLEKGSKIKAAVKIKELDKPVEVFITFHHIDGMYSYCTVDSLAEKKICHLSAMQKLRKVGNHYELVAEKALEKNA